MGEGRRACFKRVLARKAYTGAPFRHSPADPSHTLVRSPLHQKIMPCIVICHGQAINLMHNGEWWRLMPCGNYCI